MRKLGVKPDGGRPLPPESRRPPTNQLIGFSIPQKSIVGIILVVALFAFELFNFDTTRYALNNLVGNISFWGVQWATILALAFCAIDFAGLARLFTPERGHQEPKAVWYLMGAWLLGATMNAVMTWWAISLTLLSHEFGNEILSREQLLRWVPFFVATLVWLTRILFIGAISVAGEYMFDMKQVRDVAGKLQAAVRHAQPSVPSSRPNPPGSPAHPPRHPSPRRSVPQRPSTPAPVPKYGRQPTSPPGQPAHRPAGMHAKSRR
jgi:hypothetical protein